MRQPTALDRPHAELETTAGVQPVSLAVLAPALASQLTAGHTTHTAATTVWETAPTGKSTTVWE